MPLPRVVSGPSAYEAVTFESLNLARTALSCTVPSEVQSFLEWTGRHTDGSERAPAVRTGAARLRRNIQLGIIKLTAQWQQNEGNCKGYLCLRISSANTMLDNDAFNSNGAETTQISASPSDVSSPGANFPVQVEVTAGNTDGAVTPQVSAEQHVAQYCESLNTMSKAEQWANYFRRNPASPKSAASTNTEESAKTLRYSPVPSTEEVC